MKTRYLKKSTRLLLETECTMPANLKLMKLKLLIQTTKNTLIRPVMTCGIKTWTFLVNNGNTLFVFERKINWPLYECGEWRTRRNVEKDSTLDSENTIQFVKTRKLTWFGYVGRMIKWDFVRHDRWHEKRGRPQKR